MRLAPTARCGYSTVSSGEAAKVRCLFVGVDRASKRLKIGEIHIAVKGKPVKIRRIREWRIAPLEICVSPFSSEYITTDPYLWCLFYMDLERFWHTDFDSRFAPHGCDRLTQISDKRRFRVFSIHIVVKGKSVKIRRIREWRIAPLEISVSPFSIRIYYHGPVPLEPLLYGIGKILAHGF